MELADVKIRGDLMLPRIGPPLDETGFSRFFNPDASVTTGDFPPIGHCMTTEGLKNNEDDENNEDDHKKGEAEGEQPVVRSTVLLAVLLLLLPGTSARPKQAQRRHHSPYEGLIEFGGLGGYGGYRGYPGGYGGFGGYPGYYGGYDPLRGYINRSVLRALYRYGATPYSMYGFPYGR
ncbi:unnamed protein product [Darwinula stevensoni]|uniref:Uncharacterized protein n=1 Tax=Darwinula stevensoni TaxID=69355 RepID=A0A7R9ABH3_9CRUS|nr:unnamed protein product [Darwinula stevensoni]CAG0899417.1 unnamed protein product [Darwinula stevensoni]